MPFVLWLQEIKKSLRHHHSSDDEGEVSSKKRKSCYGYNIYKKSKFMLKLGAISSACDTSGDRSADASQSHSRPIKR